MSLKLIYLLSLGSLFASKSSAIRCYTCGEDDDDRISCLKFQMEDPRFTTECTRDSKSCRLSRKANENVILSRSCEVIQLDDCKIANSIEFCYCTEDLCNKINLSDDEEEEEEFLEDLLEGSGTKNNEVDTSTTMEGKKPNQPNMTFSAGNDKNVVLHGSIEKNTISSNCSICQYSWCLVSILMMICPLIEQYY